MAAAGSAERPGTPASGEPRCWPAAGRGSRSSPPENEPKRCVGGRPGDSPPSGPRAQRRPGSGERLRRRSEPERSSSGPGRRDRNTPRGQCGYRGGGAHNPPWQLSPPGTRVTNQPRRVT
ncbi:hypothetical protein EYF80_062978 [Liparis tanakae]|uniref:Uncharacterized protein n=1 Tax=Liparis tanakae TaxID=230148 RepID=A0A4Z2EDE6_9TELE|nr:hypothetical protein EYF80_062978 [Liparis tanakae]